MPKAVSLEPLSRKEVHKSPSAWKALATASLAARADTRLGDCLTLSCLYTVDLGMLLVEDGDVLSSFYHVLKRTRNPQRHVHAL